ncbi:Cu-binding protein [Cryptotrichosporon argae]
MIRSLAPLRTSAGQLGWRAAPSASPRIAATRLGARRWAGDESRARDRSAVGPFTWKAAALFVATGVGLYVYFESERAKVQERRQQELLTKSIGKPSIGGPFALTAHTGAAFTEADLLGRWTLIYFGFTNCPDICPEELDKMSAVVDAVDRRTGTQDVLPVFVSVDPARDGVEQVRRYVSEFHPRLVGLTGEYDAVKRACKSYRVYFSTPPDARPTDDYLVDHSIFFYLMDPRGQFVDAFGKNTTHEEVTAKVLEAMAKWDKLGGGKAAGI